jgi:hypothetical protein
MILIITVKAPATKGIGPQTPLGSALIMSSSKKSDCHPHVRPSGCAGRVASGGG